MKDAKRATEIDRYQKGLTYMRDIALFLISSILTPATLASGQVTCLLATQIKIVTPLPAVEMRTGLTVISNSSGSCQARSVDMPLRPVGSQQIITPVVAKKPKLADVMERLASRLGWESEGQGAVSFVSARRKNDRRSQGLTVADSIEPGYASFSIERDNAVVRF